MSLKKAIKQHFLLSECIGKRETSPNFLNKSDIEFCSLYGNLINLFQIRSHNVDAKYIRSRNCANANGFK